MSTTDTIISELNTLKNEINDAMTWLREHAEIIDDKSTKADTYKMFVQVFIHAGQYPRLLAKELGLPWMRSPGSSGVTWDARLNPSVKLILFQAEPPQEPKEERVEL